MMSDGCAALASRTSAPESTSTRAETSVLACASRVALTTTGAMSEGSSSSTSATTSESPSTRIGVRTVSSPTRRAISACSPRGTCVMRYHPRASVSAPRRVPSTTTATSDSGSPLSRATTVPVTTAVSCAPRGARGNSSIASAMPNEYLMKDMTPPPQGMIEGQPMSDA